MQATRNVSPASSGFRGRFWVSVPFRDKIEAFTEDYNGSRP